MKSLKRMLMGIAIILFGICSGQVVEGFLIAGWIVSIIGLIITFVGYRFTSNDDN